jgi:sulfide:quinone oxidoreductase
MNERVVIPGAGFDGLELSMMLSAAPGDEVNVPLIDRDDAFVIGFSKLSVTPCQP